jgi:hypothetical protein
VRLRLTSHNQREQQDNRRKSGQSPHWEPVYF